MKDGIGVRLTGQRNLLTDLQLADCVFIYICHDPTVAVICEGNDGGACADELPKRGGNHSDGAVAGGILRGLPQIEIDFIQNALCCRKLSGCRFILPLRRLLLCRCRRGIQSCRLQLGCQLIHIILRNGIHGVKLLIFCIFGFQQLHICVCLFHHCRCRLCGIFRRLDLPCGCLRGCGCLCLLYLYIASVCGEQQIALLDLLPFFDGNIRQIAGDFGTDINLLTFHCAGDKIALLRCFCIVCFCAAGA